MILELRQALDIDLDTAVVAALDADWSQVELVFYSDRFTATEGPERFRYYLDDCAAGLCTLMREVTPADVGSGPNWTHTATPGATVVVDSVMTDGPDAIFSGVSWRGGTEDVTLLCNTSPACIFEILRIRLRVDPEPDADSRVIEIREDVRFRNATT